MKKKRVKIPKKVKAARTAGRLLWTGIICKLTLYLDNQKPRSDYIGFGSEPLTVLDDDFVPGNESWQHKLVHIMFYNTETKKYEEGYVRGYSIASSEDVIMETEEDSEEVLVN